MKALFVCALLLLIQGGYARPAIKQGQNMTSAPPIALQQWTASEQPYKAIAAKIKQEHDSGKSPQALTQEYKAYAQQHPKDPVAQFAWVCAARGEAIISGTMETVGPVLLATLAKSDPGNVHDYTRYRFCITEDADKILPVPEIKRIGDKLLRYDPHDNWVRLSLINMLCDAGQQNSALPYALAWTKQEPNNPKAHSALALVYEDQWIVSKKRADANKSIAEYKEYLRLAPPNDGFHTGAEILVKNIGKMSAKQQ